MSFQAPRSVAACVTGLSALVRRPALLWVAAFASCVVVAACGGGGGGGGSAPPSVVVDPGTGIGTWQVRLEWQDIAQPGLYAYRLYTSEVAGSAGDWTEVGLAMQVDLQLAANKIYYFSVSAVDVNGQESPRSDVVVVPTY